MSRIVTTLAEQKFIIRDVETARYRPGFRLWELGCRYIENLNILEVARPIMNEINAQTQEAMHLSMLNEEGQMVYLDKVESTRSVRPFIQLGSFHPSYCVAMGKALLSMLSLEEVNRILPAELIAYTEATIIDRDELIANLKEARELGYAVNHGEYRNDLSAVAAAIFDHSGKPFASLGIVLPSSRVTDDLDRMLGELTAKGARAISLALGWNGNTIVNSEK
jgi:DNA-binding IclR family transcriptional regulator